MRKLRQDVVRKIAKVSRCPSQEELVISDSDAPVGLLPPSPHCRHGEHLL